MLSSGAGAALLITGRSGLLSLLPAALPAGQELVLVVGKLVMGISETTRQAARIK